MMNLNKKNMQEIVVLSDENICDSSDDECIDTPNKEYHSVIISSLNSNS